MSVRAWFLLFLGWITSAVPAWAIDSYRYMHVSIQTVWLIFVGLFFFVMAPLALAAVLYWRYANKEEKEKQTTSEDRGDDA